MQDSTDGGILVVGASADRSYGREQITVVRALAAQLLRHCVARLVVGCEVDWLEGEERSSAGGRLCNERASGTQRTVAASL